PTDYPGPRSQGIMREIKPQDRQQPLTFVARAQNSLRDVSSAPGFGPGIPKGPPLYTKIYAESDHRDCPQSFASEAAGKVREKGCDVRCARSRRLLQRCEFRKQLRHAAGCADPIPCNRDD